MLVELGWQQNCAHGCQAFFESRLRRELSCSLKFIDLQKITFSSNVVLRESFHSFQ
jgi:hypothetical protein